MNKQTNIVERNRGCFLCEYDLKKTAKKKERCERCIRNIDSKKKRELLIDLYSSSIKTI